MASLGNVGTDSRYWKRYFIGHPTNVLIRDGDSLGSLGFGEFFAAGMRSPD
jgi:hypothetical protein